MKIILLTPPYYFPFSAAGVPRLAGYLKERGAEVIQMDIDELIYRDILNIENLPLLFERIEKNLPSLLSNNFEKMVGGLIGNITPAIFTSSNIKYDPPSFIEHLLSSREELSQQIHSALDEFDRVYLTGGEQNFTRNFGLINLGTVIFSLAYFPINWSLLDGFQFPYSPSRVKDILKAINDEVGNPLIPYFKERVIPSIIRERPDMVGISLNHFSQFIPGFTISNLLRKEKKDLPIILGGETLTEVSRFLPSHPDLFPLFDFIALGKGEWTLEGFRSSLNPEQIPNLLYIMNETLLSSKIREDVDIDTLPTPDFDIKKPNSIIPLSLSSGCIWAKCNFCFYPFTQTHGEYKGIAHYQVRSIDKTVNDIKTLCEKFSPTIFYFTDHSIPFRRLLEIGTRLKKEDINTRFFSFIRAEKEFASLDNCLALKETGFIGGYLGLESGSQRINNLMNKGVKVEIVERILENFYKAGLISSLFCMIGFPGETLQEAEITIQFLKKNRHLITGDLSLGNFHLKYNTPVFRYPEKFGITRIWAPENEDFPLRYNYQVIEGISQQEASSIVKRVYKEMNLKYLSDRLFFRIINNLE